VTTGSDGSLAEARATLSSVGAVYDHVAHGVPSIREVLPLYRDLLGGHPVLGGCNPWGGHLAVQFDFAGGGRVELLEPTRPDSPSLAGFLKKSPRGGLHHITFMVSDLEQTIAVLEDARYTLTGVRLEHESWRELFIHPRQTAGVLIQVAQTTMAKPTALNRPLEELLLEAEELRRESGMADHLSAVPDGV
jgi:methylmalonyl-CoA/ethylmalonyl-CoA epimerase